MACRCGNLKNCPGHQDGIRGACVPEKGQTVPAAGVAQLVEHLICNQRVRGSNPFASSSIDSRRFGSGGRAFARRGGITGFQRHFIRDGFPSVVFACGTIFARISVRLFLCQSAADRILRAPAPRPQIVAGEVNRQGRRPGIRAQVGEWLKPTDCKSVPPSEVRRFESSPVHQRFS